MATTAAARRRTEVTEDDPPHHTDQRSPVGGQLDRTPMVLARSAGVLYLTVFVCGLFSEAVVRAPLVVDGDPAATAENILGSPGLFRLGFVADLVMVSCDVALAVVFYVLLRPVSALLSLLAAAFRLVHAAVLGSAVVNQLMAVDLLGADQLPGSDRESLALLAMDRHAFGYLVALVFFGIYLAIVGHLVFRSTYLPKALGVLLGLGALGYLVDSFSYFLVAGYQGGISPLALAPAVVAELATVAWLLVKGVDVQRWRRRVAAAPAGAAL